MRQIQLDEADLRALQRRAERLARGELDDFGRPVSDSPAIEDLRRAIDVLGAHTWEGLQRQRAYIAALSTAQEAERGRLARELHDEVVQQLIALGQSVDRVQRLLERGDASAAATRLQAMRTHVTALVDEVRLLIGDLRPPALAELGLIPAIELLLGRAGAAAPAVGLLVQGAARRLPPQAELAVFRIVQEAWNNIQRHAGATQATVAVTYAARQLTVTIADNGRGFVPPDHHAPSDGHWGLRGMYERAELTGGELVVASAPGAGTELTLHVPYPGGDGRDPVCGMAVAPDAPAVEHAGRLYRFCSPACRDLFLAQPQHYVLGGAGDG